MLTINILHTSCLQLRSFILHAYHTPFLPCFMLATFMLLPCYQNHTYTHAVYILMIISFPYLHSRYFVTHAYYCVPIISLMLIKSLMLNSCLSHVTHAYSLCLTLPYCHYVVYAAYATQIAILR